MLLSKEVEVPLYGKRIKHFKELGYELPVRKTKDGFTVKQGTKIKVKVKDLPKGSHVIVQVKCDYCGKVMDMQYETYNRPNSKNNDIDKDCCQECRPIKNTELNLLRYGVENQYQREEVKEQ